MPGRPPLVHPCGGPTTTLGILISTGGRIRIFIAQDPFQIRKSHRSQIAYLSPRPATGASRPLPGGGTRGSTPSRGHHVLKMRETSEIGVSRSPTGKEKEESRMNDGILTQMKKAVKSSGALRRLFLILSLS